jgi:membrane protein
LLGRLLQILRELTLSILRNRTSDLAAQLAYWSLLALFPFLIFVLTVVGYLPLEGLDRALMHEVYSLMPGDAAQLVDRTLHEVIGRQRGALLVASLAGSVWSASRGLGGLVDALNRAHAVVETRPFWAVKLRTILATLAVALASIVATLGLMIGPGLVRQVTHLFGLHGYVHVVWGWIRWPLSTLAMLVGLQSLYHFLPNVRQPFRLVTPGAVAAVTLWLAASLLFRTYVAWFDAYARTYGTLGTAVVLMTWLYLSSLAVLVGGELDAARQRTRKSAPKAS